MTKYEKLIPRFLTYVQTETRSDETATTTPSTESQAKFAKILETELTEIGVSDVHINSQSGYVIGTLPSNVEKEVPLLVYSHIDTADFNAEGINPQIVENYDGKSIIKLDKEGEFVLDPKVFPNLKNYVGGTLITTDGTTLLGADDKSGVAEIVTFADYLISHPEVKHGKIMIGLGPDEELELAPIILTFLILQLIWRTRLMVAHSVASLKPLMQLMRAFHYWD